MSKPGRRPNTHNPEQSRPKSVTLPIEETRPPPASDTSGHLSRGPHTLLDAAAPSRHISMSAEPPPPAADPRLNPLPPAIPATPVRFLQRPAHATAPSRYPMPLPLAPPHPAATGASTAPIRHPLLRRTTRCRRPRLHGSPPPPVTVSSGLLPPPPAAPPRVAAARRRPPRRRPRLPPLTAAHYLHFRHRREPVPKQCISQVLSCWRLVCLGVMAAVSRARRRPLRLPRATAARSQSHRTAATTSLTASERQRWPRVPQQSSLN